MEQQIVENLENNSEQIEFTTQNAAADKDKVRIDKAVLTSKFKNEESLLKAYNSLEAEFTKRSQRLKELQGETLNLQKQLETKTNSSIAQANKPSGEEIAKELADFYKCMPNAKQFSNELNELINSEGFCDKSGFTFKAYANILQNKLNNEEFLLSHISGTKSKDEIIKEYLQGIKNSKPKASLLSEGGCIALAPPKKPKSLVEAGALAMDFLKQK